MSTLKFMEEALSDSWVDVNSHLMQNSRITPSPLVSAGEEYLRLLREAQRDCSYPSSRISRVSSMKNSLHESPISPKSPPNSPTNEPYLEKHLKGIYINYYKDEEEDFVRVDRSTDWIWDWSSRPEITPPGFWKFVHPVKKPFSVRRAKVGKYRIFSTEVFCTLLITNIISLIIGTGIGIWLNIRKSIC